MSSIGARIWKQQLVGYVPHTDVSGDAWQHINYGTTTGAGDAGGTTVVDTGNSSSGANAYNGRYYVKLLGGDAEGELRRVIDDDGAGTLTVEDGFSAQVAGDVCYEIYLSPEPVVVVDSSASAVAFVDGVRTEADIDDAEFWVGYWAVPISGALVGEVAQITSFDPAGGVPGTFGVGAGFSAALTAGDTVLLRKYIEVDALAMPSTQAYHPRSMNRANFSKADGVVGARGGTCSFNMQLTASGSHSADGVAAVRSAMSGLLTASGLEQSIGSTATVAAGSTTSAINIAAASWQNFAVGQMVIDARGNAAFITSLEDGASDVVNVEPPLPQAPAAAELLYGTCMYAKSVDADTSPVCISAEIDGVRTLMTGCQGNVTLTGDDPVSLGFEFQVDNWIREYATAPFAVNTMYTSAPALKGSDRIAYLDTTKANIGGFTATPGAVMSAKGVQGAVGTNSRSGFHLTDYNCGATFRELSGATDELDQQLRFTARTAVKLAVIMGSHANTAAVRLPVARLIELPNHEEQEAMMAWPNVVEAQDAGTATDGDSAVQKVPDWAIHIS